MVGTLRTRLVSAARDGRLISGTVRRFKELGHRPSEFYLRRALHLPPPKSRALPCISYHGDFSAVPVSGLVKRAMEQALADLGGPRDSVRAIDGMSGQRYRTFINNFVRSHPDARYLEVGSWAGSTAAAALHGNRAKALCIDNWSQFGGPKEAFFTNMAMVRSPSVDFHFLEKDFRRVDYASLGKFNIYLFDGPHEERDQYDGVMVARPALDESFVLIVDDWNWRHVRLGTFRALRDAGYAIASAIEVRTTLDDSHPTVDGKNSHWHNGYFIAVLSSAKPS